MDKYLIGLVCSMAGNFMAKYAVDAHNKGDQGRTKMALGAMCCLCLMFAYRLRNPPAADNAAAHQFRLLVPLCLFAAFFASIALYKITDVVSDQSYLRLS